MDNDNTDTVDNVDAQETNSLLDSGADTKDTEILEEGAEITTDDVTTDNDFVSTLPEDLRELASLKKFKSVGDLAKSYVEQEKLVGRKTAIPDADASPEEWNDFYKNAGRPDDIAGYEIEVPEALAGDRVDAAFQAMHDAGLNKRQAQAFMGKMMELEQGYAEAEAAQVKEYRDTQKSQLQEAWGDDIEKNSAKVTALQKQLGVYEDFQKSGLNGNASLLIAMAKIAKDLKIDSSIDAMHESEGSAVEEQIEDLRGRLLEANKARNMVLVKELQGKLHRLYDKEYGDKPQSIF